MLNQIIIGAFLLLSLAGSVALNLSEQRRIGQLQVQLETMISGYEYVAAERKALDKAYAEKTREVNRVSSNLSRQISALKVIKGSACDDAAASDERISILRQPVTLSGE